MAPPPVTHRRTVSFLTRPGAGQRPDGDMTRLRQAIGGVSQASPDGRLRVPQSSLCDLKSVPVSLLSPRFAVCNHQSAV